MKYTVVLTEKTDGNIHVTVPGLPECIVEANTRDEALEKTRETIAEIISRSEIFQLDVSAVPKSRNLHFDTPWGWFGRFKDNPTWGKMFDEIDQLKKSTCQLD
jgi:predicted RNase H-like HicB family nuclease